MKKPLRKLPGMNRPDGGHTLITDELIATIVNIMRISGYVETACAAAGIAKDTYYDWMRKAARDPEKYPLCVKFSVAVQKAAGEGEVRCLVAIEKAATGSKAVYKKVIDPKTKKEKAVLVEAAVQPQWQAAAWKLERRFPKRWGRYQRVEMTGEDGGPIKSHQMTTEELIAENKALDEIYKELGLDDEE